MTDPMDELIAAWVRWEASPAAAWTAAAKFDAIHALGLNPCHVHDHIATCRRQGMSIPDAVQQIVNEGRSADAPHSITA